MKAQNLTICLPYEGCDKRCPYCVSKMTGVVDTNRTRMAMNKHKVLSIARAMGVTSVLLTSKGETTRDPEEAMAWIDFFSEFPVELQTNGWLLTSEKVAKGAPWLRTAYEAGLNVLALSVDGLQSVRNLDLQLKWLTRMLVVRLTVNVTGSMLGLTVGDFVDACKSYGIQQLLLRRLTVPQGAEDSAQSHWIAKDKSWAAYSSIVDDIHLFGRLVRQTVFGMPVYDVGGVSVAVSDYCVQERAKDDEIRSLVFAEDGHVYTSWNSPGSILF